MLHGWYDQDWKNLWWWSLSKFPPFHHFLNFSALPIHKVAIEDHIYIWQVLPVVTPVKYKCDRKNLKGNFSRLKILVIEKWTNWALVTPNREQNPVHIYWWYNPSKQAMAKLCAYFMIFTVCLSLMFLMTAVWNTTISLQAASLIRLSWQQWDKRTSVVRGKSYLYENYRQDSAEAPHTKGLWSCKLPFCQCTVRQAELWCREIDP